ncbi:MAG: hypothetical protein OEV06_08680 [Anaerolineae bacterium]|nr:hypothetical protein [Anaerolineae bacterium]
MTKEIAELHTKIDYLTEQFEAQRKQQESFNELKDDLIPVANHLVKLSIDELAEIGNDFRLEDLLFLLKRVLRDTHLLLNLLNQLESAVGLADEMQILGKQVFTDVVHRLDEMERKGYFAFAQQGWQIMENIVEEFDEEDVKALGDNVVTILKTVRNMTQPDVLGLANNAVDAIREAPPANGKVSTLQLMRDLADPKVRLGMARMLNMLKTMADLPDPKTQTN